MYIRKYLLQYMPVKETKCSSSKGVTDAGFLTSGECDQIIHEHKTIEKWEKQERGMKQKELPKSRGRKKKETAGKSWINQKGKKGLLKRKE